MSNVFKRDSIWLDGPSELMRTESTAHVQASPPPTAPPGPDPVAEARREAEKILADARRGAETAYQTAVETGRTKGYEEGRQEALRQEGTAARELQELCRRLQARREELEGQVQSEAVEFAFSLAEKVVASQVDRSDQFFVNLCEQAVAALGQPQRVALHVGKRLYPIASRRLRELEECLGGLTHLELACEEGAEPLYLRLETPSGSVETGVELRIRKAREQLGVHSGT